MQGIVNRTLGLGLGLVLMGAGVSGCGSSAPDWTFTDASGTLRQLSQYEGTTMVLAFSNSWCEPCQESAVHMQLLHDKYSSAGVKFVMVSSWERGDPAKYMAERGFNYGLMVNGTSIARDYGVTRVPTFFVVASDGDVVSRHVGFDKRTTKAIARSLEKHLKQVARKGGHPTIVQHGG